MATQLTAAKSPLAEWARREQLLSATARRPFSDCEFHGLIVSQTSERGKRFRIFL
jgi:hypothetical protein